MNVLLAHNSPWWNAASYYAVTLGIALKNKGINVVFCSPECAPETAKSLDAGLETYFVNFSSNNPYTFFREKKKIKNIIKEKKINIINCLSPQSHFFIIFANSNTSIPVVRSCCDALLPRNNFINRYIYSRKADYLIFPSRCNMDNYRNKLGIDFKNATVIYCGIDLKYISDISIESYREKYQIPENSLVIGHIGRWSPEKGIDFFLEICGEINKLRQDVFFLLAGKEEKISKNYIISKAKLLGIEKNLILFNWLEDVRSILVGVDLALITSRTSEVISRAALEFMVSGKPLVVSDVNILPEVVINGENGFVCKKDNKDEFVKKCLLILENNELRLEMGQKSRKIVEEKYSLEKFALQHINIYEKLIKRFN